MGEFSNELVAAMQEALAYVNGDRSGVREIVVDDYDNENIIIETETPLDRLSAALGCVPKWYYETEQRRTAKALAEFRERDMEARLITHELWDTRDRLAVAEQRLADLERKG